MEFWESLAGRFLEVGVSNTEVTEKFSLDPGYAGAGYGNSEGGHPCSVQTDLHLTGMRRRSPCFRWGECKNQGYAEYKKGRRGNG